MWFYYADIHFRLSYILFYQYIDGPLYKDLKKKGAVTENILDDWIILTKVTTWFINWKSRITSTIDPAAYGAWSTWSDQVDALFQVTNTISKCEMIAILVCEAIITAIPAQTVRHLTNVVTIKVAIIVPSHLTGPIAFPAESWSTSAARCHYYKKWYKANRFQWVRPRYWKINQNSKCINKQKLNPFLNSDDTYISNLNDDVL